MKEQAKPTHAQTLRKLADIIENRELRPISHKSLNGWTSSEFSSILVILDHKEMMRAFPRHKTKVMDYGRVKEHSFKIDNISFHATEFVAPIKR